MPSTPLKKTVKRTVKKVQPVAAPVLPSAAPVTHRSHHGLIAIAVILIFLTIGCLAAALLMGEKTKAVTDYAQALADRLTEAQRQNADLSGEVTDLKTLQALSKKAIAPAQVPIDIVWDTYSSPNLSLQYPDGYTVVKATNAFPALTIKSDKGRIEIFRMKDFPSGVRDAGCGASATGMSDVEIDSNCPKDMLTTGVDYTNSNVFPYNLWLYYGNADTQTKAVLDEIVASIKVAK
jgi:hypothetical protein